MAGRNDPCPCGSGRKYKKCCERVIALRSAQLGREAQEMKEKSALLTRLNTWFERQKRGQEIQKEWMHRFKEAFGIPNSGALPQQFHYTFRFWLLFDAPCMDGERPITCFQQVVGNQREEQRWLTEFSQLVLGCFEVLDVNEDEVMLRSCSDKEVYSTKVFQPIKSGMLVIGRLSRLGNRYELFGPYTSFVSEMRGEILMHLEKHVQQEKSLGQKFWQQRGLNVLGWSMRRAQEIEKIEQAIASVQTEKEVAPTVDPFLLPPNPDLLEAEEQELPPFVMDQLEQFFVQHVSSLQERTQELYSDSLQLFFDYTAQYFGKSFLWSKLTEEVLAHFCSVWYIDQGIGNPIRSKIFLNTLKYLFRWLHEEEISDVYSSYKSVYTSLIHTLPIAFEAKRWLIRYGIEKEKGQDPTLSGLYMWGLSSSRCCLAINGKWLPLHLENHPPGWAEDCFWLRGTVVVGPEGGSLARVDGVYPIISVMKSESVHKNEAGS